MTGGTLSNITHHQIKNRNSLLRTRYVHIFINSGNFSIRFWRQYASLFASIAITVYLLLTSDRKSSRWHNLHSLIYVNEYGVNLKILQTSAFISMWTQLHSHAPDSLWCGPSWSFNKILHLRLINGIVRVQRELFLSEVNNRDNNSGNWRE